MIVFRANPHYFGVKINRISWINEYIVTLDNSGGVFSRLLGPITLN
ncbi:Hypothetical protein OINT_2001726 [Brucella intermedia LMG 3301]|uniref:Uncharacterized protein n=1 Tax=Brucella intermedia LMG 3301 TaxID=641118 RepID=C4WQF6_9HYPH|nr:Hypothetical protein OINT_2001726 [Brucella intermedia LMG 3301]